MKFCNRAEILSGLAFSVCVFMVSLQLYHFVQNMISPMTTNTHVEEIQLSDIDFPLDILLCVKPIFNHTNLRKMGFKDTFEYIVGNTNRTDNSYYWGDRSLPMKSAKDVVNQTRMMYANSLPIKRFSGNSTGATEMAQLNLTRINWLEKCHILNFSDVQDNFGRNKTEIFINFDEQSLEKNLAMELRFRGKTLAADRMIQDHMFYSSGDNMVLGSNMSQFAVKIRKRVFVEEDPKTTCQNYPNGKFKSYAECDKKFMRDTIEKAAPGLNLTPPWLTEDLDLVTMQPVTAPRDTTGGNN